MVDSLLAAQDAAQDWVWNFGDMSGFILMALILSVGMLIWDTVEVGRNDAANLVNAVFGARILSRRTAVWVAGVGVVLGASAGAGVIETVRKGIFDPAMFQGELEKALAIYTSVYIVDTVLLYSYSAFGMPVSTTACLVFELLGAAFALGGSQVIFWGNAGDVVTAIVMSILISGVAGWLIQRAVRGAIRDRSRDLKTLLLHGGWAAGGMMAGLTYFMLLKGMKHIQLVEPLREHLKREYGPILVVLILWAFYTAVIHSCLVLFRQRAANLVFPVLAIIGMICMGFAFGQNDLANCASPGLAAMYLISHRHMGVANATAVPIQMWLLFGCGLLLLYGMTTRNAQRVTRAEVNTGSMHETVALYAPKWCIGLARMLRRRKRAEPVPLPALAPPPAQNPRGKKMHYDPLRACVILAVSASVIATASSFKLPVSTTYVAFAAVIGTGAADRILQRGDADLKLARTIWVVFSWFASAILAAVAAGVICLLVYHLHIIGLAVGLAANLSIRMILNKRADAQESRVRQQARERARMGQTPLSEVGMDRLTPEDR